MGCVSVCTYLCGEHHDRFLHHAARHLSALVNQLIGLDLAIA